MAESQVTPTDIERAAELTAAASAEIRRLRAEIARMRAEIARMRAHAEMALNEGRTADAHALMAALLTEGEDDEITRLRERIGEVIGARGLEMLSDVARYADAFTGEGQQPQGMTQAATKGKGKGAVGKGLTVTRAGRGVRMTGEAGPASIARHG